MPQCRFCDEPAFYQCVWRLPNGTLCMKLACYFHAREPDEGRAVCCDHWAQMHGERLPYVPDYLARQADEDPERFNARRRAARRFHS